MKLLSYEAWNMTLLNFEGLLIWHYSVMKACEYGINLLWRLVYMKLLSYECLVVILDPSYKV